MANDFPDHVGDVDVISDSENIKKLLKIPFSEAHISMMVHRVGKTLLLDDFDVSSFSLLTEDKQWDWLRKFLVHYILERRATSLPRKNTSRINLQNLSMFNKFLYYSTADSSECLNAGDAIEGDHYAREERASSEPFSEPSSPLSTDLRISPKRRSHSPTTTATTKNELLSSLELSPEFVEKQLDIIDTLYSGTSKAPPENQKNLLWKFEDINMLVGSDMPIFGDSSHPAVSLRLRDMKKPINVLTGLDYWLDNLMCSVPEVVMCYHLDGIVQKYELIKTEDIPSHEESQFSPQIIRNVAQNILTFLKSKATKSGHTYWLFKGKNDDVVKLYDLSSLCSDDFPDTEDKPMKRDNEGAAGEDPSSHGNPYSLPVAMLLYKVAKNLKESRPSPRGRETVTVYRLLNNCLKLINEKKQKTIAVNCHYLLADVLLPMGAQSLASLKKLDEEKDDDEFDFLSDIFDDSPDDGEQKEEEEQEHYSTLPVNRLPHDLEEHLKKGRSKRRPSRADEEIFKSKGWGIRCREAVSHIFNGLRALSKEAEDETEKKAKKSGHAAEEEPIQMARPFHPIPMPYTPLKPSPSASGAKWEVVAKSDDGSKQLTPTKNQHQEQISDQLMWKQLKKYLFLQKGAQVFGLWAEICLEEKELKRALLYIELGLLCFESAKQLSPQKVADTSVYSLFLASLLGLAGDVRLMTIKRQMTTDDLQLNEEEELDRNRLKEQLEDIVSFLEVDLMCNPYSWAYSTRVTMERNVEESLVLSGKCYQEAVDISFGELKTELTRKLGNVSNELGCYYMTSATTLFYESSLVTPDINTQLETLVNKSRNYLLKGLQAFESIGDTLNTVLLYSNNGKLMRVSAHIFAPNNDNKQREQTRAYEFSPKERHFYSKAIGYYQEAIQKLALLKPKKGAEDEGKHIAEFMDSLNWDICSTLFTVGQLLQDYAPLSLFALERIEQDIGDNMKRSLKLCRLSLNKDSSRYPLYQYRAGNICHRLGSLYHNSYRSLGESDPNRKQVFKVSDDYYSEAQLIWQQLENRNEFLNSLLERIGLHERNLSSLVGFKSKIKALKICLRILLTSRRVLRAKDEQKQLKEEEDEEEKQETQKLLHLLFQRLILCTKGLIKSYSTKSTSQYKDKYKVWINLEKDFSERFERNVCKSRHLNHKKSRTRVETIIRRSEKYLDQIRVNFHSKVCTESEPKPVATY